MNPRGRSTEGSLGPHTVEPETMIPGATCRRTSTARLRADTAISWTAELARRVLALTGSRSPLTLLPMRRGETPVHISVDPCAAEKLGFVAGMDLDEGLQATIPYYRAALGL